MLSFLDNLPPEAHSIRIEKGCIVAMDEKRNDVMRSRTHHINDRIRFEIRTAAIARGLQIR